MSEEHFGGWKQVVSFTKNGNRYIVAWLFGSHSDILLRAGAVTINLDAAQDSIALTPLPHAMRVSINGGKIWFDTDDVTASEIELMFEQAGRFPPSEGLI